jgi:hypothetical protein
VNGLTGMLILSSLAINVYVELQNASGELRHRQ